MRISDWSSDVCSSDLPFQTLGRGAFGRVDESRPYITHIGTGGDRASDPCPVADAPTTQKGFFPHQRLQFPQKRKWVVGARMAAPAGRDGDDAIDIRLERLLRVPDIDDVMEAQTSISMNRVSHLTRDAYRRDKDRNLVFHSQRDVLGQPRVRFVDGKLRRPRRVSGRQPVPYVFQPSLIASGGSLIKSRKGPDDACTTGFNHQIGT